MTGQLSYWWLLAFLSGVLLCVAAITIVNGKYLAIKRKKTKLGLVKVAGSGLKFGDGKSAADAKPATAVDAAVVAESVADKPVGSPAAGAAEATDDDDDRFAVRSAEGGDSAEGEETIAVPLDMVATFEEEAAAAAPAAPPATSSIPVTSGDKPATSSMPVTPSVRPATSSMPVTPSVRPATSSMPVTPSDKPATSSIPITPSDKPATSSIPITLSDKPATSSIPITPVDKPPTSSIPVAPAIVAEDPFAHQSTLSSPLSLPTPPPTLPPAPPRLSPPLPSAKTVIQRKRIPETVKMKERKVILAEDVEVNRELIAMYFEGSGVKFEFAVNGREVCEKFESEPGAYSLILMDIQMPVMDGYEATRRIRALDVDWAKQIPIIAMTGNDMKEDIDLCFDAGMDDHIFKPIDMELLQDKVFDIITSNTE